MAELKLVKALPTLTIYFGKYEFSSKVSSPKKWVEAAKLAGGAWISSKLFIPWHRIGRIEVTYLE